MGLFFITHVEPLHLQKGSEVQFFIREYDALKQVSRSHVLIKNVPHYFFTPNMTETEADIALKGLQQEQTTTNLKIEKQEYNKQKWFLRAEGNKEQRTILPAPFLCKGNGATDPLGLNSPSRLLRWFYPAFMKLRAPTVEEIPEPFSRNTHAYVSLEQVVDDSLGVVDIELEGWEAGKEKIFMAVYASQKGAILFHDLPFDTTEHNGAALKRVSTQKELGRDLSLIIKKEDPLWLCGHNIMRFDQLRLRELTGTYHPATNDHHPVTKAASALYKVISKGRFTFDTYNFMSNFINIFGDNRLSTLQGFKKSINYEEQAVLVVKAREGSKDAFETLVEYCISDGKHTFEAGELFKDSVTAVGIDFRRDPDSVCTTSKWRLGEEYWKRKFFHIKKTFEDSWKSYRIQKKETNIHQITHAQLCKGFQKGIFTNTHVVYLSPFVYSCINILQKRSKEILKIFNTTQNKLKKFVAFQALEAQIDYLIREIERIINKKDWLTTPTQFSEKQKKAFYCLFKHHGLMDTDPEQLVKKIQEAFALTEKGLAKYSVINKGTHFYYLKGEVNTRGLEKSLIGCYIGTGTCLSLSPGKIISNPFESHETNCFVYDGKSITKGEKSNGEKRILSLLVKSLLLEDEKEKSHENEIKKYSSGASSREDYFIPIKTRTYFKNLLEDEIEKLENEELSEQFRIIKKNINERFSPETQKKLNLIVDSFKTSTRYAKILELSEKIKKPFPPVTNRIISQGCLVPESSTIPIDHSAYVTRIQKETRELLEILSVNS